MKKNSKLFAVILAIVMVVSSVPAYAGVTIENVLKDSVYDTTGDPDYDFELPVKDGMDISEIFKRYSSIAKDDKSGNIYRIRIPKGNYKASGQLVLWSNTYVYMNGSTITHTSTESNMLRFGYLKDLEASPASGYNGFSNIRIYDGTLDGGGLNKTIMQIGHSQNLLFSGVNFRNVKNSHMVEVGGCANVTFDRCSFTNFKGNWNSTTNYEALQFEVVTRTGGHFAGYPNNGDETPCRNITVQNCSFRNLQRGLGTHTGIVNSYFTNMNFSNNTFQNITGFAIIATNYKDSKINSNSISNCGSGIMYRTVELAHKNFYASKTHGNSHGSYVHMNSQIVGNRISVTKGYAANCRNVAYGIQLNGEYLSKAKGSVPKGDFRCSGVTIQGNAISYNCTGYGIWLIGAAGNRIHGNNVTAAIVAKGKGGTGDCIRVEKSINNTFSSNVLTNSSKKYASGMSCISLKSSSKGNNITGNTMTKAKKDGVRIVSSRGNSVTSNTIKSCKRDGIHIEKSKKTVIVGNVIKSCKRYGVSSSKKLIKKFKSNKIKKCKRKKSW